MNVCFSSNRTISNIIWLELFRTEFELKDILSDAGADKSFKTTTADFSGIDGTNKLHLNSVVQSTSFSFVGRAVSRNRDSHSGVYPRANLSSRDEDEDVEAVEKSSLVKIDRPFYFFVRHDLSNLFTLVGRFEKPQNFLLFKWSK